MRITTGFSAGFLAALLLLAGPAQAIVSVSDAARTAGLGVSFLDGVARLDITRNDGSFGCSGSLLAGGAYVLTAAHCVSGETGTATTSSVSVSLKGGTVTASLASYVTNPGWNGSLTAGNDLALIKLASPVTGVDGYALANASAQGGTVVLAGYGYTGTGQTGSVSGTFGTLYYGSNEYDGDPSGFTATYLYDFDGGRFNTFGSTGLGNAEVLIAAGDSGGPGLVLVGGTYYLAGVHSFDSCSRRTCPVNSSFGEVGGDISVFDQAAWLQSVMSASVTAVPEPQTYALLLGGLLVVGAAARRAKGRKA